MSKVAVELLTCIFCARPLDSIRDAVLTVSPKRQNLGMVRPTTPAATGPVYEVNMFIKYKMITIDAYQHMNLLIPFQMYIFKGKLEFLDAYFFLYGLFQYETSHSMFSSLGILKV